MEVLPPPDRMLRIKEKVSTSPSTKGRTRVGDCLDGTEIVDWGQKSKLWNVRKSQFQLEKSDQSLCISYFL